MHIRPWEWLLLTYGETLQLAAAVDRHHAEAAKPADGTPARVGQGSARLPSRSSRQRR